MTEAEWLACDDPERMLKHLRGGASDRKLRLFAVVCCRRIWDRLPNAPSRGLVEVSERYADGVASEKELAAAEDAFSFASWDRASGHSTYVYALAQEAVNQAARSRYRYPDGGWEAASGACNQAFHAVEETRRAAEREAQCDLLRCIIGNPFRPVSHDPAWRTTDALTLAQGAYENRFLPAGMLDPTRLALLADALEDAGCDNTDILNHLRSPCPHARGCWAVDLVLGKQ